ncbi:MAG: hypothetical protein AAFZ52_07110, partial [Bacteroidota bacterium]
MGWRNVLLGAAAGAVTVIMGCGTPPTEAPPKALEPLATDRWTYVEVDSAKAMWGNFADPEWLRYFGLAAADLNGDGLKDIVTGRN